METINLQSSDNVTFEVELEIAKRFGIIKIMLLDLGMPKGEAVVIPLPEVSAVVLKKIIEWAEYHKNDPEPKEDDGTKPKHAGDVSLWDKLFFDVEQPLLFGLILAANYLDFKALLDVACKTVANSIIGKTTEQIRQTFNIENDFSPEEKIQVRNETHWLQKQKP